MSHFFSSLPVRMGFVMMLLGVGWCLGGEWEKEDFRLAPEVEKQWEGWMEAGRPLRVKKEMERMVGVIAALQKEHGLDEAAVKELGGVVPGLVEATVRDWEQFLRQTHRPTFQGTAQEGLEAMGVFKQDPVTMMAGHEIAFDLLPQERAAFVSAVKRVLPGEVFQRWEAGRVKLGEDRKNQARAWVEAGILERKPRKIYAGELAQALESGLAVLGKDSEEGKAMVKQVESWAVAYEEVCRKISVLRADSFLLTGPGWEQATKQGWFLFLPRRTGVIKAHREVLTKMTMESGGGARLAALAKRWEPEDFTLESVVELAWEKQMVEARKEHRRQKKGRLEREVEKLRKSHGLSEAGAAAMKREIPSLIEAGVSNWEQSMRAVFRVSLKGETAPALRQIEQRITAKWLGEIPGHYRHDTVNGTLWADLLRRHLSAVGYVEWEKERTAKLEGRAKETEALMAEAAKKMDGETALLKGLQMWARDLGVNLEEKTGGVKGEEEAWVGEVRKGFRELVNAYEKASLDKTREWLDVCPIDGPTWTNARKKGFYFSMLPVAEWKRRGEVDLMKLVPEEAVEAGAQLAKEREKWMKGVVVKARVMIVEQMVSLDAGQLKAVEALAAALPIPTGEPLLNPEAEPEHWKVWKGAEGSRRLNELLDDRQERMVAKGVARFENGNRGTSSSQETEAMVLRHPALGAEAPEAVEEVVSEHLAEASRDHAMKGLESIMRDVDAVVRVLNVDEEKRATLELAAKGTVQAGAEAYRVNQGRWIRSQTQGATTATIRNRLRSLGGYSFSMGNEGESLVEEVLNEVIDDKQRGLVLAYQDDVKGRRDEVIAEVALARMQTALGLSTEQRERLGKALVGVMETYGPDIEMNFRSWSERMPWFLQNYYLMLPGSGVGEAELKGLLNDRQREIWDEQVTERGGHYWSQILEYHERRVKGKSGPVANRRIFFQQ